MTNQTVRRTSAQEVADALQAKKAAKGWIAKCPCHDDRTPSLSINEADDGSVLLHCHAGCDQATVAETVKGMVGADVLSAAAAVPERQRNVSPLRPAVVRRPVARYADPVDLKLAGLGRLPDDYWLYQHADGSPAFYVTRYNMGEGKTIRPWIWGGSAWINKAMPAPRPIYRLPEVLRRTDAKILLFEGEKTATAGGKLFPEAVSSTWAGGASAVKLTDFKPLAGRVVVLCPDNDEPGYKAMSEIADILQKQGAEIWQCDAPDGSPDGWDVADAEWSAEQAQAWLAGAQLIYRPDRPSLSYAEFAAQLTQPEWVVHGIIQRGQVVSLTARTNHGKTAISLHMALCIAAGRHFGYAPTKAGRVLILCGEDPDGFRVRLIAAARHLCLPADALANIEIIPEPFPLAMRVDEMVERMARDKPYGLVLVDTSVAYFHGDKEDDNVQARDHAMALRKLKRLPGAPAVLVNCHPTKSADQDNLIPRGGSAFLNEIDQNLKAWATGQSAEFHWHQKKRGPDFEPMQFEFHGKTVEQAGMRLDTVIALPVSDERERELSRALTEDENRLLFAMLRQKTGSFADWATASGWTDKNGQPLKSRVSRTLDRLKADRLVKKYRGRWELTADGSREAEKVT